MDFINFFGYKKTGLKIQTGFPYPFSNFTSWDRKPISAR